MAHSMLNRPEPVSEQIRAILAEQIRSGKYGPDDRLPSETDLAETFEVSRATIRTALAGLSAEGLIERKQGVGTFVQGMGIEITSPTRWEFVRLIEESGREAGIQVLAAEEREATAKEAAMLRIRASSRVLSLKRLFTADEFPAIYSINVVPLSFVRNPYAAEAFTKPITWFLENHCGQVIHHNTVDISAMGIEAEVAEILVLSEGTPILRLEEIFHNDVDVPLFCAINYFNDQRLRMRFVRASPS